MPAFGSASGVRRPADDGQVAGTQRPDLAVLFGEDFRAGKPLQFLRRRAVLKLDDLVGEELVQLRNAPAVAAFADVAHLLSAADGLADSFGEIAREGRARAVDDDRVELVRQRIGRTVPRQRRSGSAGRKRHQGLFVPVGRLVAGGPPPGESAGFRLFKARFPRRSRPPCFCRYWFRPAFRR